MIAAFGKMAVAECLKMASGAAMSLSLACGKTLKLDNMDKQDIMDMRAAGIPLRDIEQILVQGFHFERSEALNLINETLWTSTQPNNGKRMAPWK